MTSRAASSWSIAREGRRLCPTSTGARCILGHGGGRQEGGRRRAGRGGQIFPAGKKALFAPGEGKDSVKLLKRALKQTLFEGV